MVRVLATAILFAVSLGAQTGSPLADRAVEYLQALIRIDSSNPPGNESRVAEYLQTLANEHGIENELLGGDPERLNFIARLRGTGRERPLLLMAHMDVVPAETEQWNAPPFSGEVRDGFIYGRGALDAKNLLAAHFAVLVELKRRSVKLKRDIILLAEADEEAGASGIRWLIENAYPKLDAEFAINEGGSAVDMSSGVRLFQIQTAEKIPTRLLLTAQGTAGHGSMPRPDNAIVRLSRAITRLMDEEQPVRWNSTTRRYFRQIAELPGYRWLEKLLGRLETDPVNAAAEIRPRAPELDAMLRTTISPTMLTSGVKINVIPNTAQAGLDVRRLPNETREEVISRFSRIINDRMVSISSAGEPEAPAAEPSSLSTALYRAMHFVFSNSHPKAAVAPFMSRGATDAAFLREKGMAVYGAPLFLKEPGESRAHGNDERISLWNMRLGTEMLWNILIAVAVEDNAGAG